METFLAGRSKGEMRFLERLGQRLEWRDQAAVFEWAASPLARTWPEIVLLNGSLNGVRLSPGAAVKAKRCGLKKGFPDLFLPVARGGFHGLFIELKATGRGKDGKRPAPEPEQRQWLSALRTQGYMATVCWGSSDAIAVLCRYLDGNFTKEATGDE